MRVLVTGHNGYLGSVLTPLLVESGHEVVGLDTDYYAECTLVPRPHAMPRSGTSRPDGREIAFGDALGRGIVPDAARVPALHQDLRDLAPSDLAGFEAVIHLAALSNDPLGNLNPSWTQAINVAACVRLAELAKAAGVERFLFSSSCIMYGMSEAAVVTEASPLDPKTDYARSKVQSEQAIAALAGDGFSPTFLRNGTIYGLSPRMRFDTVLNNLMGSSIATGTVILHGDGSPWRPVVHIEDVSRAFLHVLQASPALVHNQAFNVGDDGMNVQMIELATIVARIVNGCRLECLNQPDADQRTYKTDFGKFARTFPDFRFRWTVEDGARELSEALRAIPLTRAMFTDGRFIRVKWLRHLLDTGQLDESLHWSHALAGPACGRPFQHEAEVYDAAPETHDGGAR